MAEQLLLLLLTRPRFVVWLTLGKSVSACDTVDHFSGPLHATFKARHPCSSIEAGSASRTIGFEQCARRRYWVQLGRRCHRRIRAMHWPCLQPPVQGVETVSGLNACSRKTADKRKGWVTGPNGHIGGGGGGGIMCWSRNRNSRRCSSDMSGAMTSPAHVSLCRALILPTSRPWPGRGGAHDADACNLESSARMARMAVFCDVHARGPTAGSRWRRPAMCVTGVVALRLLTAALLDMVAVYMAQSSTVGRCG